MSNAEFLKKEYETIIGYRAGARYCKADLHTHSPASECSGFALPAPLEKLVRSVQPKSGNRTACRKAFAFLASLRKSAGDVATAFDTIEVKAMPRLSTKQLKLRRNELRLVAIAWLEDLRRECGDELNGDSIPTRGHPYEMLKLAHRDIENLLASYFFPEEFVLRCHIERLQVVALTDHNHPGYIVPRVQQLGTWYDKLREINAAYEADVAKGGEKVRQIMLKRLDLAKTTLGAGQTARRDHVTEWVTYWQDHAHTPGRLVLLPGVEITVSAVHLLAIFPPTWYVPGRIGAILRSIGIPEAHWGQGFIAAATSSVQDTMTLIAESGGIAIPAHSNSDFKGLLRLFKKGLELRKVLEHPALAALETVGGTVIKGKGGKRGKKAWQTLKWLSQEELGDQARPLCFVKGSDAHECRLECDGTGEDLGARYTNVKIDLRPNDIPDETFAALRMALLSGQSRVVEYPVEDGYDFQTQEIIPKGPRENLLKEHLEQPLILGLTVEGASSFAGGLSVRFSPYLNCIVGSGGKSTLVRTLGYALGVQSFREGSENEWLPDAVRVFWTYQGSIYCIERVGKSLDPGAATANWYTVAESGTWAQINPPDFPELGGSDRLVEIWPPKELQDDPSKISNYESDVIDELVGQLKWEEGQVPRPLLITQPRDIFNAKSLFETVLGKPHLKLRQIIWATANANVPVCMDAEKVLITSEVNGGTRMELVCGGDLSEAEIREKFLDCSEGGAQAFRRRQIIYGL